MVSERINFRGITIGNQAARFGVKVGAREQRLFQPSGESHCELPAQRTE